MRTGGIKSTKGISFDDPGVAWISAEREDIAKWFASNGIDEYASSTTQRCFINNSLAD